MQCRDKYLRLHFLIIVVVMFRVGLFVTYLKQ